MRKFNGDKAMTCKECFHYEACKSMLEAMGYVVDGDGEYASLVCNEFQAAADVVEVVRCKDCKLATVRRYTFNGEVYHTVCNRQSVVRKENDFCSYGERRTDP